MHRTEARQIVNQWMFPTATSSYMGGLEERPILAQSLGSTVTDTDGKTYLDFQSGQMGGALGHQHPRIVKVIQDTIPVLLHASKAMLNVPRLRLHETLGKVLPKPLQKSLFLVSGSDAIEASIDLARKATGGLDVLGLHTGLHGSTSYLTRSLSFAWNRSQHAVVAPATSAILTPHCYRCPLALTFPSCNLQCLKTSMELADANFTSKPAAFIGEPILSAGGVIVPPPGYYQALREECDKRDMLLIFDESQTGLGKTGKLFGFQHETDVQPDIITISKHFGGGLPISAVCTTADIAERAVEHGYFATRSHAADPLLCAAGEESIKIVVEEDMAGKAARIERRLRSALDSMAKGFELIGDIRGRGVLIGIELVTDREKKTPANAELRRISQACLDNGLIFQLRGTQGDLNVIRLVPPMTTTDAEIDRAMSILYDAIKAV
ncbi:MAG: aspartate aminotransferase family protein [bacterium]|nr:aspartate aminotransferase family protein [bacterium]